jgi:hypothetical protein
VEARLERTRRVLAFADERFRGRFGERLGLADLMAPYGGRPDLPPHVRSFPRGAPLVVFLWDDRKALAEVSPWAARGGEFEPFDFLQVESGRLHLGPVGERAEARAAEAAVVQLLHWYTRQRSRWSLPRYQAIDFLALGLGPWLTAFEEDGQGTLRPVDVNPHFCAGLRAVWDAPAAGMPQRLLPLRDLVGAARPSDVPWEIASVQSWALVQYLDEGDGGRWREGFGRFVAAALDRQTGPDLTRRTFEGALGLASEEDWEEFEAGWRRFVADRLLAD